MSASGISTLTSGGIELDLSPDKFGFLLDSTAIAGDPAALRHARMDRDGVPLFLPGYLDREAIDVARHAICETFYAEGMLEPGPPVDLAVAASGGGLGVSAGYRQWSGCGQVDAETSSTATR